MINKLKGFFEKKEGEIVGIASTDSKDRQGESINQSGWDLKQFKMNPVILLSHDYQDFPIGKAVDVAVKEGKLVFKFVLTEATQKAKEAAALIKEGVLNAFSVGFIARERDTKDANIITKSELLEISLVSVPANPDAIVTAKSMDKNELAKSLIKQWLLKGETKEQVDLIEQKSASEDAKASNKTVKKVEKVENIDLKLAQSLAGKFQELCRQLKKEGGAVK